MNLELYKPTDLEQWINAHYQANGICTPQQLDLYRIAKIFNAELYIYSGPSTADWQDGEGGHTWILLNEKLSETEQRAEFFHELAHPLRHCGRQDDLPTPFVELQEMQAYQFQLVASLPVYMLEEYQGVQSSHLVRTIADDFCLPLDLVNRRLEQIRARIAAEEWMQRTKRFRVPRNIDITKPYVIQAIQDLRAIQRKKNGVIFNG